MILKDTGNNQIQFFYEANDVIVSYTLTTSALSYIPYGITWSLSGDLLGYYANGSQVATDSGLGVMVGNFIINIIGARNDTPSTPWLGNGAHAQLYNTPLSANQMAYLMKLP